MNATAYNFEDETADCESAEGFLEHFAVPYERAVVHVNRLHILQRFHDYVAANRPATRDEYRGWLARAYEDFVRSDAQTEELADLRRVEDQLQAAQLFFTLGPEVAFQREQFVEQVGQRRQVCLGGEVDSDIHPMRATALICT
jgi:nitrogenase-stabilizing/protective protein